MHKHFHRVDRARGERRECRRQFIGCYLVIKEPFERRAVTLRQREIPTRVRVVIGTIAGADNAELVLVKGWREGEWFNVAVSKDTDPSVRREM